MAVYILYISTINSLVVWPCVICGVIFHLKNKHHNSQKIAFISALWATFFNAPYIENISININKGDWCR